MSADFKLGHDVALVRLLALAEEGAQGSEIAGFLSDPSPQVRAAAIDALTDVSPGESGVYLAKALSDPDATVREAAIDALAESRQFILASDELDAALDAALVSPHEPVRAAVVRLCQARAWRDAAYFSAALCDPGTEVRKEGVRGLVALDAVGELGACAADPSPEVRRQAAASLCRVRDVRAAAELAMRLCDDPDVVVVSKALESLGTLGYPPAFIDRLIASMAHDAWQVRKGAATALSQAQDDRAVAALCIATTDSNLDVRKAAVQSLGSRSGVPAAHAALLAAAEADVDADVRAYARMALESST